MDVPKLVPAINLRIGRVMVARTQGISHRHRHLRILFGTLSAAAILGAPVAWTQLDAPLAHADPPVCTPGLPLPGCPAYVRSAPAPSACPVAVPGCPGYIPPPQAFNNPVTPPSGDGYHPHGGKPGKSGKPGSDGKPGSQPDGKPGSPGAGGDSSQSSPPAGAPNAPDHTAPAPDASEHTAPAPAAPPAPAPAGAPDVSGPAPAAPPAPGPVMSAPAPVMSAPAPVMSAPSK